MNRAVPLIALALAGAALSAHAQQPPADRPPPCSTPEFRQFDFWIGEWAVSNPDGEEVGRNHIQKRFNGCVLHESWTSARGFTGESFNTWDPRRGVWHQTWVDGAGTLLLLEGGLQDGAMVLSQDGVGRDGKPVTQRITWTPLEDGRVRQHWQVSRDGGETWETAFDGYYSKVE